MAADLPTFSLSNARDGDAASWRTWSTLLATHGFVILKDLPTDVLESAADCEAACAPLLSRRCRHGPQPAAARVLVAAAQPLQQQQQQQQQSAKRPVVRVVARPVGGGGKSAGGGDRNDDALTGSSSDLHIPPDEATRFGPSLPLERVGVFDNFCRAQLHVVADRMAVDMMPWDRRGLGHVRDCVVRAIAVMCSLTSRLMSKLQYDAPQLEHARMEQAASRGDVSVLDVLLYPNPMSYSSSSSGGRPVRDDEMLVNMREHTDPGLLTLTLASSTPGLQIRDRASGEWIDVEASCTSGVDAIVFAGEALQFGTVHDHYIAAPHRVRAADAPRLSTVFELRMHEVCVLGGALRNE